ncbi:MAG: hypothetical protein NT033_02945, partial [Candidatus Omnitrophica bacterium]|nr:hypothetical protein [Candidatus Omnitrophota bacterium]
TVSKIKNDNVKIDTIILAARLRQMLAVDTNAYALYADLSLRIDDEFIKAELLKISKDEKRHCVLELEALSILED